MMKNLDHMVAEAINATRSTQSLEALMELRVKYLGKKGLITALMQTLKDVPKEEKPKIGAQINVAKQQVDSEIKKQKAALETSQLREQLMQDSIDVTLPGKTQKTGKLHPITLTINRVIAYFQQLGFTVSYGPEIENDYYNFEALNISKNHPARTMHDTFYIDENTVLRTHTSPVQIRTMQQTTPPLAVVCPGKVYRCDSDQTHSPMFHQVEGLYVDRSVSFSDLRTILIDFLQHFFEDKDLKIRFRPSYFPFTEPSAEVDIAWKKDEKGALKWLEVLGCGMVHPNVLKNSGIDPKQYKGFALGLGIERFAMLRYGVSDLRQFFESDLNFLGQF